MRIPINLAAELKAVGMLTPVQEFRKLVVDSLLAWGDGDCTPEWILIRPDEAKNFADLVRLGIHQCQDLPDHVILGTLLNTRKRSEIPNLNQRGRKGRKSKDKAKAKPRRRKAADA